MGSDIHQKKLDKLARVRENQRKSRAKKQEHIRDLEQKLLSFQEQAHRRDVEHRLAVQRLEAENSKLRYLLSCSGMSSSTIEDYLKTSEDPAMTQKVAIPSLRRPEAGHQPQPQESRRPRPCPSPRNQPVAQSENPAATTHPTAATEPGLPSLLQAFSNIQKPSQDKSVCGCAPGDGESWPTNEDILNTTLCAIAEELINQYNTRGMDMEEIRTKLWTGFSKGLTTEEGCRVQNQILFQVLDEISNN